MKKKLTTLSLLILLGLAANSPAQMVPTTARILIGSAECAPGESFAIDVSLDNSIVSFAGLQLPLRLGSPEAYIDSVSFVGSLKPEGTTGRSEISVSRDMVTVSYYPAYGPTPFATVSAAGGVLATVYGHVDLSASPGEIPIDTVYQPDPATSWTGVGFSDALGLGLYTPGQVTGGTITVLSPTSVDDSPSGLPGAFSLSQNYPNPFNPVTSIEFTLPTAGHTSLHVYNIVGQSVAAPLDGHFSAGRHRIEFDASAMPSGIYFYRLSHQAGTQTRKMVLLK